MSSVSILGYIYPMFRKYFTIIKYINYHPEVERKLNSKLTVDLILAHTITAIL